MQCHSLAVGHRKRCDETAFHIMCCVTHLLLVLGKDVLSQNVHHSLPVDDKRKAVMRLSQNVQCRSLPVGHRKTNDETAFDKMCNVTHLLLVIGKDVAWMRLLSTDVTHFLLVIGKDVRRLPFTRCVSLLTSFRRCNAKAFTNVQCHSLPVGHRKRCDEIAFHKMCNVAHLLLAIGKDVTQI